MICKSVHHWRFFCPIVFLTIFSRSLRAATMGSFGWTTCLWLECWLRRPTSATATSATSSPSTRTGMRRLALKEKVVVYQIVFWNGYCHKLLEIFGGPIWRGLAKQCCLNWAPKKSLSQLWTNRNFGYCRKIWFHSTPCITLIPQTLKKVLLTGNVWFGHVPPDNEKLHKKR